jgi:DNA-binding MarR family transcriptional regulator
VTRDTACADSPTPGTAAANAGGRAAALAEIVGRYDALMHRLSEVHAPEFLEIATTMPQAKVLYLLAAATELHMSDLVARLGVSLSTVSGLVDRLVDQGLAARREDPADRRQVLVSITAEGSSFIDRFRELNARQLERLLQVLDDPQLATVHRALELLAGAAQRVAADGPHAIPDPTRKDAR